MGLARKNSSIPVLPIDYSPSTTVASVYTALATLHIRSTQSLKILSYVQGQSELDMPSWVPDWTKSGLPLLPALPIVSGNMRVDMLGNELSETLRVRGRKLGNVWTETVIFKSNFQTPGQEPGERSRAGTTTEGPLHWLLHPSKSIKTQICSERQTFWQSFHPYLRHASAKRLVDAECFADIPPSFGGFCANCHYFDNFQWSNLTKFKPYYRNVTLEQAFDENFHHLRDFACRCATDTYARRQEAERENTPDNKIFEVKNGENMAQLSSPHFLAQELAEFNEKLLKFGRGRRLFGTEYTLGLGPENIQEGDEVWLLEDAEVPLILRRDKEKFERSEQDYKLVGECYSPRSVESGRSLRHVWAHDLSKICRNKETGFAVTQKSRND